MLCKNCKNKHICKHYDYINLISVTVTVNVTACESYTSENDKPNLFQNQASVPSFRQPIEYPETKDEINYIEDEEKIIVDLSLCKEESSISIADIIMKGDNNNGSN